MCEKGRETVRGEGKDGAQPPSAKPKAMREAHGARRRRAGCAPFLREAEMCGGDIDTGGGGPYYNGVIYLRLTRTHTLFDGANQR